MQVKLRIGLGIGLVAVVLAAGLLGRSGWWIVACAPCFTISFLIGRWRTWRSDFSASKIFHAALIAALTQLVLIGMLYLLARGAASLLYTQVPVPWQWADAFAVIGISLLSIFGASVIYKLEQAFSAPNYAPAKPNEAASIAPLQRPELTLGSKITPDTFFQATHYSHSTGGENTDGENVAAVGSEDKITIAEQRLGLSLPAALRALYLRQNGGSVGALCIVNPGIAAVQSFDDVVTPFGGYEDLLPTEMLETLFTRICNFADPDSPEYADQFPDGCRHMLVLAQWYQSTLFLDFNTPGEPKAGYVDFQHVEQWPAHVIWWPSFADFFAQLRRYES
jgi:hypothetical protein